MATVWLLRKLQGKEWYKRENAEKRKKRAVLEIARGSSLHHYSLPLASPNPKTHFNSAPFSLTKTLNIKEPTKRAQKFFPLHVAAAPPSQSPPSVRKEEEGNRVRSC
uniref:Uncharacterized protein n=1 Tax=Salix viminalis TaxID=40686 RepID=A0A6N2LM45_SALVM